MPKKLSRSVKIKYLDKAGIRRRLDQAVGKLVRRYPEIERVVLFGSLARDDAVPGSDADLLVVLRESNLPFLDRFTRYLPNHCGIGVEVFAYTKAELEKMTHERNLFILDALREGETLFERART